MNNEDSNTRYTQNRELSWLKFNERVLEEAQDTSVPLYERLKFVSIFHSNLDEFFMIRVGSLFDLSLENEEHVDNKSGLTPLQQLEKIYQEVHKLYVKKDDTFFMVENALREYGVCMAQFKELLPDEKKYAREVFKRDVLPILSPQIVDRYHPFPFLENKRIYLTAKLKSQKDVLMGILPIPASLPQVLFFPGERVRYISMERLLMEYMDDIFAHYTVEEKSFFRVTRNADISAEDESFDINEDFRDRMKKLLKKRKRLAIVRLEIDHKPGEWLREIIYEKMSIVKDQIFVSKSPLHMQYVFSMEKRFGETQRRLFCYTPFQPQPCPGLSDGESVISQVKKKDFLLFYPYESMHPFLQLISEAAHDPAVLSISISIYRLANKAKLVDYLCQAAENGKEVTVLIELRARFDEQNNIDWSERLENEGCRIVYGFDEYKVHSKICLIARKEHGEIRYLTQVGTGNYNEKTSELYTDLSLMTANQDIGRDAMNFFRNMTMSNLDGRYGQLMVAPYSLKNRLMALIDSEIAKKENGRIVMKVNSVTDLDIIYKLSEASRAGVQIDLLVRGICCILPGVPGRTDNVRVKSIVGRYLEHARIYSFGTGAQQRIYISSADLMTRNTQRRVEIACPVLSEDCKARIRHILEISFYDTAKSRLLQSDGSYIKSPDPVSKINSQQIFMEEAEQNARERRTEKKHPGKMLMKRMGEWLLKRSSG